MRRHLRWLIPLALAPAVYIGAMWGLSALTPTAASSTDLQLASLMLLLLAAAFVGPVVLAIIAAVQGAGVYRRSRQRRGHFSKAELASLREHGARQHAWENARALRRTLLRGEVPATLEQWELRPLPNEHVFAAVPMTYARYYGTDVAYSTSSNFAYGHPAFVLGVMALGGLSNAAARSAAQSRAREQWREWQTTHVLVTNRRLAVRVASDWLSFDYQAMVAVYPEVAAQTLVCQFESTAPLMLQGPHAPIAAIMSVFAAYGLDGVARHPSLAALN